MEALSQRGEKMPAAVRVSLDMAITLRDEANAFYRALQADDEQQRVDTSRTKGGTSRGVARRPQLAAWSNANTPIV